MHNIDHTDRQLIGYLRANARASIAFLAKKIGVSRATVQNRLHRLEQRGIITGYTALVSPNADNDLALVRALMNLELDGNVSAQVTRKLLEEPSVSAIHSTNGRWDMILELETSSLAEFDQLLWRIKSISGVSTAETNILLSSHRTKSPQA